MKKGVEDQWMSIPLFYLKNVGGPFIFDCDYDVKFLGLKNIPAFYEELEGYRGIRRLHNNRGMRQRLKNLPSL